MKFAITIVFCLLSTFGMTQLSSIKGTALDDSGEPLPFAHVSLNDSIGTQTDVDGVFRFDGLEKGKYTVKVDYVGYPSETQEVKIKKTGIVYKVTITMSPGAVLLKPAIYLYSDQKLDVNIELGIPEGLIFTHPKYESKWTVTVEGDLIAANDQQYDYLFWESNESARSQTQFDETQGFCIAGSEAIDFLESSAKQLGFNERESNDFVSFWGPRISELAFAQIYFKIDDTYDEVMPINVTPQPDASRRVFMLVKPLEAPKHLEAQTLTSINRDGFVLIEWGGSLLSPQSEL